MEEGIARSLTPQTLADKALSLTTWRIWVSLDMIHTTPYSILVKFYQKRWIKDLFNLI